MLSPDGKHLDLDCGIAYGRIALWLDDELALPRENGHWTYSVNSRACRIELEPLESRAFGNISIERTRLTACGDAEALASFERLFTLRFISAGG